VPDVAAHQLDSSALLDQEVIQPLVFILQVADRALDLRRELPGAGERRAPTDALLGSGL
jgi:hypothetical protein